MSAEASRFSIKQRLKSANNSLAQEASSPHTSSSPNILVPEHYNYFINTINKEIRHEEFLCKNIRKKIDNFKTKELKVKSHVKNGFVYSHKAFVSSSLKHSLFQNRKLQAKTAYQTPKT